MIGRFFDTLGLGGVLAIFAVAAAVILVAGTRMSRDADRVADRLGVGEALTGTVVLGLLTALPGLVASIAAALEGAPTLAIANAVGGIAAQTVVVSVADLASGRTNLEHAAASPVNLIQATMLCLLITIGILGFSGPDHTWGHVHPMSVLMIAAAVIAIVIAVRVRRYPMWKPRSTEDTVPDQPDEEHERASLTPIVIGLVVSGALTIASGIAVAQCARRVVIETGLPETIVGGVALAMATSSPELVTSVAAVRRGAPTLAVSDIVGGNIFDICFLAFADLAYLSGSIFHAPGVGLREVFLCAFTLLLNLVLLSGLICRQRRGPANIGLEGVLLPVLYLLGFAVLFWMP